MASILTALLTKYSPDQPRDKDGKFGSGGSNDDPVERVGTRIVAEAEPKGQADIREQYDQLVNMQKIKLSFEEKSAVIDYADTNYKTINRILREGKSLESCEQCPDLDTAISKASLPREMNLYRGATLSDSMVSDLKLGSIIQDKGYVSTSISSRIAATFTAKVKPGEQKVVFSITAPKGAKALAMGPLGVAVEKEVVLPRGSMFRVDSVGKLDRHGLSYTVVSVTHIGFGR